VLKTIGSFDDGVEALTSDEDVTWWFQLTFC
jgi:hypothetical protein